MLNRSHFPWQVSVSTKFFDANTELTAFDMHGYFTLIFSRLAD